MRRKHSLWVFLIVLCFATYGYAQLWSGIIAPNRAVNWSTAAGVQGGIPSATWTQCGSTIAAYNGAGQTIQTAINNCAANHYVLLGPGTFNLTSGFSVSKNGVVVRGSGANQTFLVISGFSVGASCGYFYGGAIKLCASDSVPQTSANWTAGYAPGTTRITLSSTNGIAVGTVIFLDQLDDASDGWPASGDLYICTATATSCSAQGGGTGFGRSGRATMQAVKVTNIVGGGQLDITPPINLPSFRASQSPGALWATTVSNTLNNAGVEDLSIDYSKTGGDDAVGFEIINTRDCWVKGVRVMYTNSFRHFDFLLAMSMFDTIRDNYIYDTYFIPIASYPIEANNVSSLLIENNIIQGPSGDLVTDGPFTNSVFSYNFSPGHFGPGEILHGGGEMMDLYEGNLSKGFWSDINHGTHGFQTIFRNAMIGNRYDPGGCLICNPIQAQSRGRFYNVVGNVMGDPSYNTYETQSGSGTSIYDLGWQGNASGSVPPNDSNVARTIMRWGNWDSVTSTADNTNGDQTGTRWCGNSSNTGWSTRCASKSEVPSSIASFPNPIPSTETLPPSLYYSSRPSWWPATKPWPAMGPDVSGGNITNMGGHAYTNPAADCYFSLGGAANGSSGPLSFNATTCYGGSGVVYTPPAPPTAVTSL
jgi:hypothetical protein